MVLFKTEDGDSYELPGDASEFTFGQWCDICHHLQSYDAAVKDANQLETLDHLRAALKIAVTGDIDDLPLIAENEDELSLSFLMLMLANSASDIPATESPVSFTGKSGKVYTFDADRYASVGGSFEQAIEVACLERYMPEEPFTSSTLTSTFYSITLQQCAILFREQGVELRTMTPEARDNWLQEVAPDLRDMPAHYALNTRTVALNFIKAWQTLKSRRMKRNSSNLHSQGQAYQQQTENQNSLNSTNTEAPLQTS